MCAHPGVGGTSTAEEPTTEEWRALYNAATKKGGRVGFKTLADGAKVRYFKKTGEVADVAK